MKEEHTSPQQSAAQNNNEVANAVEETQAASGGDASVNEQVNDVAGNNRQDQDVAELRAALEAAQAENQSLTQQVSDLKDQFLRTRAEMENVRKRLIRDKEESIQFANKQLLLDVVTIIDDFERAIRSADETKDFQSFYEGVGLIERQFVSTLERKWGLQRFDAMGEEFDPQRHEAVVAEPRADLAHSTVLEVYQKGFLLHDRVLRTAKVKVSMPE